MTSRPLFLAAIVSSTVLAALSGCGKSASQSAAEMAIKAASGGKVDITSSGNGDKSQVTIKTDQGVATVNTGGNVALPKDFPSDVHLPAGYTIKNAMQMGPTIVLTMHAPAAMQALYSEYDSSMKSGGWTEAMAMQSSQSESVLTFQKGQRNVTVSILGATDSGGGSDVSLQSTTAQK
jgi:DNA-binding protein YbaB